MKDLECMPSGWGSHGSGGVDQLRSPAVLMSTTCAHTCTGSGREYFSSHRTWPALCSGKALGNCVSCKKSPCGDLIKLSKMLK